MPEPMEQHGLLAPEAGKVQPVSSLEPVGVAERKIRVLVVDDMIWVRTGLVEVLQLQKDIEVIGAARDGHEALELIRRLRPDAVVMDVHMPGMNGIEATRQLVQEWPTLPVIGLSVHEREDHSVDAILAAGAVSFVPKGEVVEALAPTIRRWARWSSPASAA